jgi:hypothetical protein
VAVRITIIAMIEFYRARLLVQKPNRSTSSCREIRKDGKKASTCFTLAISKAKESKKKIEIRRTKQGTLQERITVLKEMNRVCAGVLWYPGLLEKEKTDGIKREISDK